jgi:hypothetical protein
VQNASTASPAIPPPATQDAGEDAAKDAAVSGAADAALTRADRAAWRARLHWPDDCEGAFQATDASGDAGLRIDRLADGSTLVQIRCAAGAYQPSQVVMRTTATERTPAASALLSFTTWLSPDGASLERAEVQELWGELAFLPATQELTLLSLSRQTGDCGTWAKYTLAGNTATLDRVHARLPCPATPGAPASPAPGRPPEGWAPIDTH